MTWDNKTRPNKTAKIPYAYKADDDDPLVHVPDPDMVPLVEQAMDYLDEGHSSRRTADWLSEKSNKMISHQGLSNIWKAHRSETSELLKSRKKQRCKNAPKTEAEKRVKAAKRKRSDANRVLTMAEKKIAKLEGKNASENHVSDNLDFNAVLKSTQEIVFTPNPGPQTSFLAASEREVLYGGAAASSSPTGWCSKLK